MKPPLPSTIAGLVLLVTSSLCGQGVGAASDDELQWKTDPEKALEDQSVRAYSICLQGTARGLSRTSNDPSELVEQASFARCAKNRQMVFDTFHRHNKSFSPEAMTALEQEFRRKLPQIVLKTRDDLRQATQQ